jgi:glycosyltransferase 2 family protein
MASSGGHFEGFVGNVTNAIARVVSGRAIWNRISIGLSIIILAVTAFALYRLLSGIDPYKVLLQLQTKSLHTLLSAAAFVSIAYLMTTFYDFFALRTIGRNEVPYRIAAFGGFAAYTIGHNVGAMVLTAGAVRFRIYSAWGLKLSDIAKVAFLTGLICWLGNACVLMAGMSVAPEAATAVNQLPSWLNRAIGLFVLTVIGGYMLWLLWGSRVVGFSKLRVPLPNAPVTLLQLGIVAVDLGAAAGAMYALLPLEPTINPIDLSVIFITAFLIGLLSHSPGSLGVIEAAMLVGLPQFDKEALLASLLLFRVLYSVFPFLLASIAVGLREILLAGAMRFRRANACFAVPAPAAPDTGGTDP